MIVFSKTIYLWQSPSGGRQRNQCKSSCSRGTRHQSRSSFLSTPSLPFGRLSFFFLICASASLSSISLHYKTLDLHLFFSIFHWCRLAGMNFLFSVFSSDWHSFISSENWLWLVFVLLFLVRIWEIWGSGWSVSRVLELGIWWICRQTSPISIICSSFCWLETLGSGKVVFFWASPLRLSMISLLRSVIPTHILLNCLISTKKVVGESFLLEDCSVIKLICIYFVYLFVQKAIQIAQSLAMPLMEGADQKLHWWGYLFLSQCDDHHPIVVLPLILPFDGGCRPKIALFGWSVSVPMWLSNLFGSACGGGLDQKLHWVDNCFQFSSQMWSGKVYNFSA